METYNSYSLFQKLPIMNKIVTSIRALLLIVLASFWIVTNVWAQEQVSGHLNLGGPGSRDPANQFTLDSGLTWEDAYIVTPNSLYATPLTNSQYISFDSDSNGLDASTTTYRTVIWPSDCRKGWRPFLTSIKIHADNQATAYLSNRIVGTRLFIGAQQLETPATLSNFQDAPEELVSTMQPLQKGPNVLEFDIFNESGPTAFDYIVTFTCKKLKHLN